MEVPSRIFGFEPRSCGLGRRDVDAADEAAFRIALEGADRAEMGGDVVLEGRRNRVVGRLRLVGAAHVARRDQHRAEIELRRVPGAAVDQAPRVADGLVVRRHDMRALIGHAIGEAESDDRLFDAILRLEAVTAVAVVRRSLSGHPHRSQARKRRNACDQTHLQHETSPLIDAPVPGAGELQTVVRKLL